MTCGPNQEKMNKNINPVVQLSGTCRQLRSQKYPFMISIFYGQQTLY